MSTSLSNDTKTVIMQHYPEGALNDDERSFLKSLGSILRAVLPEPLHKHYDHVREEDIERHALEIDRPEILMLAHLKVLDVYLGAIELETFRMSYGDDTQPVREPLFAYTIHVDYNARYEKRRKTIASHFRYIHRKMLKIQMSKDSRENVFGYCIKATPKGDDIPDWMPEYVRYVTISYHNGALYPDATATFKFDGVSDDSYDLLCDGDDTELTYIARVYGHIISGKVKENFGEKKLFVYWTRRGDLLHSRQTVVDNSSGDRALQQIVGLIRALEKTIRDSQAESQ